MLSIVDHASPSYGPRTRQNAADGDVTVAFAVDFETAGERLTRKAAGDRWLGLPLTDDPISSARTLYRWLRDRSLARPTVNVAGNGLHSLSKHGWTQDAANRHVFAVLSKVHEYWPIGKIVSGGQTGIDLAGIVTAHALCIDARALLPKGFIQRDADGVDRAHTQDEILAQVVAGVQAFVPASARSVADVHEIKGSVRVCSKRAGGTRPDPDETLIDGDRQNPLFGNRHHLKNWQDPRERAQVIQKHLVEDFEPDVATGGPIYREMERLAAGVRDGDKIAIVCWCRPLPCHCDCIADGIYRLAAGFDLQAEVRARIRMRQAVQ